MTVGEEVVAGRVAVVGSLNVDLVTGVHRHPAPGETVLGDDLVRLRGGKGANQALAAVRAGAEVTIIGRVGDDEDGRAYRQHLAAAGIDVTHLVETPGVPTGTALIVVDAAGENTIVVAPGANARLSAADVRAAAGAITDADVLLVQLEIGQDAVDAAADIARAAGTRLVLNASPVRPLPASLRMLADPLLVNEHEAEAYAADESPEADGSPEAGGSPEADGSPEAGSAERVCVTLGSRGAQWGSASAAPPSVSPVDTTGAGDAFAGALAAALAAGLGREAALTSAVGAGAAATLWEGAQQTSGG
ncbi:ribokinase [Mumia xiangluensis]|uniref:Ribokinase n=1 Tax=Mumia xiangluensis TaxID=1678900 RepID=A0ABW1QKR0_9ACTN